MTNLLHAQNNVIKFNTNDSFAQIKTAYPVYYTTANQQYGKLYFYNTLNGNEKGVYVYNMENGAIESFLNIQNTIGDVVYNEYKSEVLIAVNKPDGVTIYRYSGENNQFLGAVPLQGGKHVKEMYVSPGNRLYVLTGMRNDVPKLSIYNAENYQLINSKTISEYIMPPQGEFINYRADFDYDKLNDDVHLINHLGHANQVTALKMTVKDIISRLTNDKYFILYSQGCLAGAFSPPGHDCFAEYMTVNSSHGAVAAIMNAHYGWGVRGDTDGPSQRFDREFWDALFAEDERKVTLGKANQDSKEDNLYRIDEPCMRWCYYELNLFGDPALAVKGAAPDLGFSQKSFDFGKMYPGETNSKQFEIWNKGNFGLVDYHITTDCDWIAVSPTDGSCDKNHKIHDITVDTSNLENGTHAGKVIVTLDYFNIKMFLTVKVKVGSVLACSPYEIVFQKMDEGQIDSKSFDIWNDGIGSLAYSLSESCPWLEVSPLKGSSTGESDPITVSVDTSGLSNGWHNSEISIDSNGGEDIIKITVGVGPVIALSENYFDFEEVNVFAKNKVSTTFKISNVGIKTLHYSLSPECDWIAVEPSNGHVWGGENDTIEITINKDYLQQA